jgi:hypothetical protein
MTKTCWLIHVYVSNTLSFPWFIGGWRLLLLSVGSGSRLVSIVSSHLWTHWMFNGKDVIYSSSNYHDINTFYAISHGFLLIYKPYLWYQLGANAYILATVDAVSMDYKDIITRCYAIIFSVVIILAEIDWRYVMRRIRILDLWFFRGMLNVGFDRVSLVFSFVFIAYHALKLTTILPLSVELSCR